jgi:ABC-2 type transport system ATP-binding protein
VHRVATLRAEGVEKRFGSIAALRGASLTLRIGELVGLIGPNGAGKTTLLECMAGLVPGSGGTVAVDDVGLGVGDRKRELFYLPDGIVPWPDQRASDVLAFVAGLFRAGRDDCPALIESLRLASFIEQRIGSLSKGERKRVLLAAALMTPQRFLLLDEPFDGLDVRQAREVAAVLRAHAERGRGLCLSVHQLADAARLSDRLVLLAGGRTVGEGTLAELRVLAGVPDGGVEEMFLALT